MGSAVADDASTTPESTDIESAGAPNRLWLALAIAAATLVADQLTKVWALASLDDRTIEVVWTLQLNLVINYAGAFSLGGGRGPLIGVLAIGVVAFLLWQGRTVRSIVGAVGLGMVLGGAIGNLTDRALRTGEGILGGGVVDFIDFQWWPVFNLADIGVVVGAGLLLLASWRHPDGGL